MTKRKACLPIISNQDSNTPAWDPIPDSLPRYDGLACPFCTKMLSSISNRDRHIRHYCDHAKQVFFEKAVDARIEAYKLEIRKYLNSLDPNTTIGEILIGQNIITNREYGTA